MEVAVLLVILDESVYKIRCYVEASEICAPGYTQRNSRVLQLGLSIIDAMINSGFRETGKLIMRV